MNLFTTVHGRVGSDPLRPDLIEVIEPLEVADGALPPEGNVKLLNYRLVRDNLRVYSPTGDVHTSPSKGKLVSRFEVCNTISPPRTKILELLRPEDPGRDALEAIVKPAPRRGFIQTLDEDSKMYLQRALLSPSPRMSEPATPEPQYRAMTSEHQHRTPTPEHQHRTPTPEPQYQTTSPEPQYRTAGPEPQPPGVTGQKSLAEELHEAERGRCTNWFSRECQPEKTSPRTAFETEPLMGLRRSTCGPAGRLDALLAESRDLHEELADIHADMQAESARAVKCAAAARALAAEARGLGFLDDVLALLRGDVAAARRAHAWPFAVGTRDPERNYII